MALNEKVNQRVFYSQAIMAASRQTADTLTAMVASLSRAKSCQPTAIMDGNVKPFGDP